MDFTISLNFGPKLEDWLLKLEAVISLVGLAEIWWESGATL
jgi:hypothetical protein